MRLSTPEISCYIYSLSTAKINITTLHSYRGSRITKNKAGGSWLELTAYHVLKTYLIRSTEVRYTPFACSDRIHIESAVHNQIHFQFLFQDHAHRVFTLAKNQEVRWSFDYRMSFSEPSAWFLVQLL